MHGYPGSSVYRRSQYHPGHEFGLKGFRQGSQRIAAEPVMGIRGRHGVLLSGVWVYFNIYFCGSRYLI